MKLKHLLYLSFVLLLGVSASIPHALAASSATVTVDASTTQGSMSKHHQLNNFFNKETIAAEFGTQDKAKMQEWNTRVLRIWLNLDQIWNGGSNYDYTGYDAYFTQAEQTSTKIMLNTGAHLLTKINDGTITVSQYEQILKDVLTYFKSNYSTMVYVEASNEYKNKVDNASFYYNKVYIPHYKAVNYVNANTANGDLLQLGGPVTPNFDTTRIPQFLDNYKNDSSTSKKLDFISYHVYELSAVSDPSTVGTQKNTVRNWLSNRGLNQNMNIFITEYGLVNHVSTLPMQQLRYINAAGAASMWFHWTNNGSQVFPFNWVHQFPEPGDWNNSKNQFYATDGHLTPHGKNLEAQHRMLPNRISASSNVMSKGKGVYAIASTNDAKDTITIYTWNYQYTNTADYQTTINVNNLPSGFANKNVRITKYKIDPSHDGTTLDLVSTTTVAHSGSVSTSVTLNENELAFFLLEAVAP